MPDLVERYLASLNRLYGPMLDRLVALRPGGLLVTDNTLWDGEVVPGFAECLRRSAEDTRAIADYNERLNAHPMMMAATVSLRDGVAISVKRTASAEAAAIRRIS